MDNPIVVTIVILSIIFLIIVIAIISSNHEKRKTLKTQFDLELLKKENVLKEKDLELQNLVADARGIAQEFAAKQFEDWKNKELETHRKVMMQAATDKATALLQQWIIENEERIRKDAANRSVRNVLGKVTEHLIPFSEAMSQFNPKDIRFVGSPIDLIVFSGAEALETVTIHFIEVKTGTSALSKRQQLIRDAIDKGRVKWLRVNQKDFGDEVNEALKQ
ncbi:MAG: hypothetical protein EKK37_12610 [Sphingobacteriales bacterium]|nr:MAG: hypothetical protein EKK37_12610 [Sphingobacteriales bacterium]